MLRQTEPTGSKVLERRLILPLRCLWIFFLDSNIFSCFEPCLWWYLSAQNRYHLSFAVLLQPFRGAGHWGPSPPQLLAKSPLLLDDTTQCDQYTPSGHAARSWSIISRLALPLSFPFLYPIDDRLHRCYRNIKAHPKWNSSLAPPDLLLITSLWLAGKLWKTQTVY